MMVSVCSSVADGGLFEPFGWMGAHAKAQHVDRCFATSGLLYAAVPKLWPFAILKVTFQLALLTCISIIWLVLARAEPDIWKWALLQTMWHVVSASALAFGVHCSSDGTGACLLR